MERFDIKFLSGGKIALYVQRHPGCCHCHLLQCFSLFYHTVIIQEPEHMYTAIYNLMFSPEFELTNHIALIVSHDDPSFFYVGLKTIQKSYIPNVMLDCSHEPIA